MFIPKQSLFLLLTTLVFNLQAQQLLLPRELQAPGTYVPDQKIELADIDGDGDLDLFTKDASSSKALIYLNQQGVMDSIPQVIAADIDIRHYVLEDWNADGLPDLICENHNNGDIYLRFNQGGLVFGNSMPLGLNSNLEYLFRKDLNGDGFVDLYDFYGDLNIYQNNNGDASFTHTFLPASNFITGGGDLADLDGDGIAEAILHGEAFPFTFENIYILRNTGNYQFTFTDTLVIADRIESLRLFDLNGDNGSEIIYLLDNGDWRVIRQTGASEYLDLPIGNSGDGPNPTALISVYDMDGNGFRDLRINNDLYLNNQFNFTKLPLQGLPDQSAVFGDTNDDSTPEAWWTTHPAAIHRADYQGNGSFATSSIFVQSWPADENITPLDVDNDHDIDFVYINNPSNYLMLSRNNNGVYSESFIYTNPIYPDRIFSFHFNNDNYLDLLVGPVIFQNDGQGNFTIAMQAPNGTPMALGDLNNDGLDDVVIGNNISSQPQVAFYLNNGNGFTLTGSPIPGGYSVQNHYEAICQDLNGDGWKEMIISSYNTSNFNGSFTIYQNNGGTSFEVIYSKSMGWEGKFAGLADMTGDEIADMVYLTTPGNDWPNVHPSGIWVVPNHGDGTFGTPELVNPFLYYGGSSPFLSDVTNDGLPDLVDNGGIIPNLVVMVNEGFQFGPVLDQGSRAGTNGTGYPLDHDYDGDLDISFFGQFPLMPHSFSYWENISDTPYKIAGQLFFDNNANGQYDPGETLVPNLKTGIDSLQSYAVSDSLGRFSIPTGGIPGTFELKVFDAPHAGFEITTQQPILATNSEGQPIDTVLIGLKVIDGPRATLDQVLSGHRCNETGRVWVSFSPITNGPVNGELKLHFPPELTWQDVDSLPGVSVQGEEITWPISNMTALSSGQLWADFIMPDFQSAGDTLHFTTSLTIYNGSDTVTVQDTLLFLLTCAYDPNDKMITNIDPFLVGDQYYTTEVPDRVEYLVRFQNTGNDTAANVLILDNLSSYFDFSTFQFMSASHPGRINLDANGLLRAEFPDIALPDSSTNFIGSMGYVKFAISLKPNPPRSKPIPNRARIFFDQNPPVGTNIARLNIVDCSYFVRDVQLENASDPACVGTTFTATVPNHGLPQTYQWTYEGLPISQTETATDTLRQLYNEMNLHVSNAICQADTTFVIFSSGIYPDLQLSQDSSFSICDGTPIEITSNIPAKWYRNETLVYTGTNYTAAGTESLSVTAPVEFSSCPITETLEVTAVPIPANLIAEGDQNQIITYCAGETINLSSAVDGLLNWWVYNSASELVYTASSAVLELPSDLIPGSNNQIFLNLDTLNCSVQDFRWGAMVSPDFEFYGDSILCENEGYISYYLLQTDGEFVPIDSAFVYRDDILVLTQPAAVIQELGPVPPGDYTIEVFTACSRDTFYHTIYGPEDFPVGIFASQDTLYTINGFPAIWFYAPSLGSEFIQLPGYDNFRAQAALGYYFLNQDIGGCSVISDTFLYQLTELSEKPEWGEIEVFPNPTNTFLTISFSRSTPKYGELQILDLWGRVVQTETLAYGTEEFQLTMEALPAGIYFIKVMDGQVPIWIEKVVKL